MGNGGRTGSHEKGRQKNGWSEDGGFHQPPKSHLLPTGVEKVSQPYDIAVVQLPHNLQLSVLGDKGRASENHQLALPPIPSTVYQSPTPVFLPTEPSSYSLCPSSKAPLGKPLIPHPQPIPLTQKMCFLLLTLLKCLIYC